jgi:hypothetical protein
MIVFYTKHRPFYYLHLASHLKANLYNSHVHFRQNHQQAVAVKCIAWDYKYLVSTLAPSTLL